MPNSFTGPESFYSADAEAWWAAVDKALKGSARQKLYGKTEDGLDIAPLYERRTDSPARALRAAAGDWSVVQRIDIPDPAAANAQILEDLEGGASGLDLIFRGAAASYGNGIRVDDLSGVDRLLKDVELDLIDLRFEAGRENVEIFASILALLEKRKIDPASVRLTAGIDPYGWVAVNGVALADMENAYRHFRDLVVAAHDFGSPARVMKADGRIWHEAGQRLRRSLRLFWLPPQLTCACWKARDWNPNNGLTEFPSA